MWTTWWYSGTASDVHLSFECD